jgi:hypothetical protein
MNGTITTLASSQTYPMSLAIDSNNLYWTTVGSTTSASGTVNQLENVAGGTPAVLYPGVTSTMEICNGLDDDCNGTVDDTGGVVSSQTGYTAGGGVTYSTGSVGTQVCNTACQLWNAAPGAPAQYASAPGGLSQSTVAGVSYSGVTAFGQSFVAPVTGDLTQFNITSAGSLNGQSFTTATAELWDMSQTPWVMVWSSGKSFTLPAASMPSVAWTVPTSVLSGGQADWYLTAPATPPPVVVAGHQYMMEFVVPSGSTITTFTPSLGTTTGSAEEVFYVAQGGALVAQPKELSFNTWIGTATTAHANATWTNTCIEGRGACGTGTQGCTSGSEGACSGETGPSNDYCNGLDDDCDGITDDGFGNYTTNAYGSTIGQAMCPIVNGMKLGQLGYNPSTGMNQNCTLSTMYGVNSASSTCGVSASASSAGCQLNPGTSTVKNGYGGACMTNYYDFDSNGGTAFGGYCNGCEAYDLSTADIANGVLGNGGANTTAWCPASTGGYTISSFGAPNGQTWGTGVTNYAGENGWSGSALVSGNLTVFGTIMTGNYNGTYTQITGGASVNYYQGATQYGGHNYFAILLGSDNYYTGASGSQTQQYYFGNFHIGLSSPGAPTNCGYPAPQYRMNVYSALGCNTSAAFGSAQGSSCSQTSGAGITSFDLIDNQDGGGTSGQGYGNNYRSRNTGYANSGNVPVYIDVFRTDGYPDCDGVIGGTANGVDNTENYGHAVNYSEYTLTIQKS